MLISTQRVNDFLRRLNEARRQRQSKRASLPRASGVEGGCAAVDGAKAVGWSSRSQPSC